MNLLIISGNLGKDAELKHLPNETEVAEFSMAVNSGYGDSQKTIWIRCSLFGNRAAKIVPYLLKGSRPTVTGQMSVDEWGEGKYSIKCNVSEIDLPPKPNVTDTQAPKPQPATVISDDDIPF